MGFRVEVARSLSHVPEADWDALLCPDDAPLLSWAYLQGLEATGCVGGDTGWSPAHVLLYQEGEAPGPARLRAAAPGYLKSHSDGEWVFDLDWAELATRCGCDYYPKWVLAVPFNPVTGHRVLVSPALPRAERDALRLTLLAGAAALCQRAEVLSLHALFCHPEELPLLHQAGFLPRQQEQYHFLNSGLRDFDHFLEGLRAHRRNSIRRERRALQDAGVIVRTLRGLRTPHNPDGFTEAELDTLFDLYVGTSRRYTGDDPFLNRALYRLLAERLGPRLELVIARAGPGGRILGGAFNLRGAERLYGRYWGEAEHVPFLHFEVCFYHPVERCIQEGLAAFEPGHGGEQKLLRGFSPVLTYSAHALYQPRLQGAIAQYLQLEAPLALASLEHAQRKSPLHHPPSPELIVQAGSAGPQHFELGPPPEPSDREVQTARPRGPRAPRPPGPNGESV